MGNYSLAFNSIELFNHGAKNGPVIYNGTVLYHS